MDVPELLRNLATYLATVPGVGSAHYPPPNDLQARHLPAVVLFWGGDEDTVINTQAGRQQWLPAIKAQLLGAARRGDTPQEFVTGDNLITPLVDSLRLGSPNELMPGLSGHVDHVTIVRVRPTLLIGYAGHEYYGAELFFSTKFYRYAQRGTP